MFAKVAVRAFTPAYELLDAPHSLRRQSKCGRQPDAPDSCGPHASGCGMAWRGGDSLEVEKRGPKEIWDASYEAKIRSLRTDAIIAHNRLASPGLQSHVGLAHPFMEEFQGKKVAFCHNGGIWTLMEKAKKEGLTDSQLLFRQLLESAGDLDHESLGRVLGRLATEWSYTSLSGMLLTPERLHVWRCYDEKDPRRTDYEKYYTLWMKEDQSGVSIASEAMDENKDWGLMTNRTLLTLQVVGGDVQRIRSGF